MATGLGRRGLGSVYLERIRTSAVFCVESLKRSFDLLGEELFVNQKDLNDNLVSRENNGTKFDSFASKDSTISTRIEIQERKLKLCGDVLERIPRSDDPQRLVQSLLVSFRTDEVLCERRKRFSENSADNVLDTVLESPSAKRPTMLSDRSQLFSYIDPVIQPIVEALCDRESILSRNISCFVHRFYCATAQSPFSLKELLEYENYHSSVCQVPHFACYSRCALNVRDFIVGLRAVALHQLASIAEETHGRRVRSIVCEAALDLLFEDFLVPQISALLFELFPSAIEDDNRLTSVGIRLSEVPSKFLSVDPSYQGDHLFSEAISTLRSVSFALTPARKLFRISSASELVFSAMRRERPGHTISLTDFAPVWVFCVLRSRIPRLRTTVLVVKEFGGRKLLSSELGASLRSLESACNVLVLLGDKETPVSVAAGSPTANLQFVRPFVVAERSRFRGWADREEVVDVLEERVAMRGYDIVVVPEWIWQSTAFMCTAFVRSENSAADDHKRDVRSEQRPVLVSVCRLRSSLTPEQRFFFSRVFFEAQSEARGPAVTPVQSILGTILVVAPDGSESREGVIRVEGGDFDRVEDNITRHVNLLRLGCNPGAVCAEHETPALRAALGRFASMYGGNGDEIDVDQFIRRLQKILRFLGFLEAAKVKVCDGRYGPLLRAAVCRFQEWAIESDYCDVVPGDGSLDRQVWQVLSHRVEEIAELLGCPRDMNIDGLVAGLESAQKALGLVITGVLTTSILAQLRPGAVEVPRAALLGRLSPNGPSKLGSHPASLPRHSSPLSLPPRVDDENVDLLDDGDISNCDILEIAAFSRLLSSMSLCNITIHQPNLGVGRKYVNPSSLFVYCWSGVLFGHLCNLVTPHTVDTSVLFPSTFGPLSADVLLRRLTREQRECNMRIAVYSSRTLDLFLENVSLEGMIAFHKPTVMEFLWELIKGAMIAEAQNVRQQKVTVSAILDWVNGILRDSWAVEKEKEKERIEKHRLARARFQEERIREEMEEIFDDDAVIVSHPAEESKGSSSGSRSGSKHQTRSSEKQTAEADGGEEEVVPAPPEDTPYDIHRALSSPDHVQDDLLDDRDIELVPDSPRIISNFGDDLTDLEVISTIMQSFGNRCKPIMSSILKIARELGCDAFAFERSMLEGNRRLNFAFMLQLFTHWYRRLYPLSRNIPSGSVITTAASGSGPVEFFNYVEHLVTSPPSRCTGEFDREELAFRDWINSFGERAGIHVSAVFRNLTNGIILLKIIDIIAPGVVEWSSVYGKPESPEECLENCRYVLDLCECLDLNVLGMRPSDIVGGQKKMLVLLLWQLQRTSVFQRLVERFPSASLSEQFLIEWAQKQVSMAGHSHIIRSFKDGSLRTSLFFLDLLSALSPGSVDFSKLSRGITDEERYSNAMYTITVARQMGIFHLLFWEDIVFVNAQRLLTFVAAVLEWAAGRQTK